FTAARKKYDLKFKLSVVKFAEQNKAELQRLSEEDSKRARLRGGGRKKSSEELELQVCEWIHSMRARHLRVSRKMTRKKAKEIHATVSDCTGVDVFAASAGWLDKFLHRNNLQTTTVAQKDARHFTGKLLDFVPFTTRLIEKRKKQVKNICCSLRQDREEEEEEEFNNELVAEDDDDEDI
uniref:HTH CENPB-type domain-containing protein n=1 Tax=Dicentrarchus labrax TaxID=13489 RepID=A0A8P4GGZ6_DICLA